MDYPQDVVKKLDEAYKSIQEAEQLMVDNGAEDAKTYSGAVYDALEVMKTKSGNQPTTGQSATTTTKTTTKK